MMLGYGAANGAQALPSLFSCFTIVGSKPHLKLEFSGIVIMLLSISLDHGFDHSNACLLMQQICPVHSVNNN